MNEGLATMSVTKWKSVQMAGEIKSAVAMIRRQLATASKTETAPPETFSRMLLRLMEERNISARDLYTAACMDRKLFSKIRKNDEYQPKKNTAIRFALALGLSLEETKKLLEAAGFTLSDSIRKDRAVADCITKGRRSVWEVNRVLAAHGLEGI